MIAKNLTEMWTSLGPALGDHLWQSTVVAVVAGLLTLILRKNHARARYWLWMAASLKFLVPFSLLVGVGNYLSWTRTPAADLNMGVYSIVEEVSRPFTQPATVVSSGALPAAASASAIHFPASVFAAVWLLGFAGVISIWYLRWRRFSAALREAEPVSVGREVEALRRMERVAGISERIEMRSSLASLEPGIFGITRPILVWPKGISEHLDDAHLEAIVAHEVWHVRRRDNLVAAIHMVVEAVFWFHPLVWWLGARLVDERERACDEEVVAFGSERRVYAESILKTCEFCVEGGLACVSGVTGADLKKRIVHIMTEGVTRKLDFGKKVLLSAAGVLAIAVPILFGLLNAQPGRAQSQTESGATAGLAYDVASIKPDKSASGNVFIRIRPDGFSASNVSLQTLILDAYQIEPYQISGAPKWADSEKFDLEAKLDQASSDALQKLAPEERMAQHQHMLQALLADRFKLTLRHETKEAPVYALVIAKNGSKLHEAKPGDPYENGIKGPNGQVGGPGMMMRGRGMMKGQGLDMSGMVRMLSGELGRTVVDKTGLRGKYDFTLNWTPEEGDAGEFKGPDSGSAMGGSPSADSGPSIFDAIQEQLGLKLESQKGPVENLVIDHVEKPSEN